MKDFPAKSVILLAILVAASAGLLIGYFVEKKVIINQVAVKVRRIIPADYQHAIYSNDAWGYTLKYPASWTYSEEIAWKYKDRSLVTFSKEDEDILSIQVLRFPEAWWYRDYANYLETISEETGSFMDNLPTKKRVIHQKQYKDYLVDNQHVEDGYKEIIQFDTFRNSYRYRFEILTGNSALIEKSRNIIDSFSFTDISYEFNPLPGNNIYQDRRIGFAFDIPSETTFEEDQSRSDITPHVGEFSNGIHVVLFSGEGEGVISKHFDNIAYEGPMGSAMIDPDSINIESTSSSHNLNKHKVSFVINYERFQNQEWVRTTKEAGTVVLTWNDEFGFIYGLVFQKGDNIPDTLSENEIAFINRIADSVQLLEKAK